MSNQIDLQLVRELLTDALATTSRLDGLEHDDSGTKSAAKREVNNDLLFLADSLNAMSVYVRQQWWQAKGRVL